MRLEVWLREDIENILWATQSVMNATATASGSNGRSIGYDQGFKSAIEHITQSFETTLLRQETWSCEDIEKTLSVIRAVTLSTIAAPEGQTRSVDYDHGFSQGLEVALWCVATSFGVNLLSPKNVSLSLSTQLPHPDSDPLWFSEDIKNILLATIVVLKGQSQSVDYHQGFDAALRCVATSFGIGLLTESGSFSVEKAESSAHSPFHSPFWLRKGIENKLLVIYRAMQDVATAPDENDRPPLYWQGFEAALRCTAMSFGVRLP
ncbi:MAG: hypothetical protein JSU72_20905 [Deltaproteobacteria bacterium]|nr:MAG: hypothetical protein JSU72_20905 [Deltaproteobacteria bacterium]